MLVIGLTGGIASGKSAAADRFAAHGVPVIDTDLLAREVVEPGTRGLEAVRRAFGDAVIGPDGALDRRRLRERIFADEEARTRLNAIIHPLIGELIRQRLAALTAPYAILVVPLLVEGGLSRQVDRILVIDVAEDTQIHRVMARDAVSREQAAAVLRAQASRDERLGRADDVITNDGSMEALNAAVDTLHERYLALARQGVGGGAFE